MQGTTKGFFLLSAFLCLLFAAPCVNAQSNTSETRSLSDSVQRVVFDRDAFFGEGVAMPRWENGYLVVRQVETFGQGTPNIRLYDQTGTLVRTARIWFPGAQRVLVYSVAIAPDRRIVVAGSASNSDGTVVPFITSTDAGGKPASVLQTKGFVATTVCLAPDGSVWAFGGTGYDGSQPNPGDTLRHFDLESGQIGSYLPRSTFAPHPGPEVQASIQCSGSGLSVYSPLAPGYIEMKYSETAPHLYHAVTPSGLKLRGFASTGPNQIYGFFSRPNLGGLYYLSFDETGKTVTWIPMKGTVGQPANPGVITGLWGSDGDKLLVSRGDDGAGVAALHWTVPVKQ